MGFRQIMSNRAGGDVGYNTMIWFCSNNGPEGNSQAPGSAKNLRGRKRSLYEGGGARSRASHLAQNGHGKPHHRHALQAPATISPP